MCEHTNNYVEHIYSIKNNIFISRILVLFISLYIVYDPLRNNINMKHVFKHSTTDLRCGVVHDKSPMCLTDLHHMAMSTEVNQEYLIHCLEGVHTLNHPYKTLSKCLHWTPNEPWYTLRGRLSASLSHAWNNTWFRAFYHAGAVIHELRRGKRDREKIGWTDCMTQNQGNKELDWSGVDKAAQTFCICFQLWWLLVFSCDSFCGTH